MPKYYCSEELPAPQILNPRYIKWLLMTNIFHISRPKTGSKFQFRIEIALHVPQWQKNWVYNLDLANIHEIGENIYRHVYEQIEFLKNFIENIRNWVFNII